MSAARMAVLAALALAIPAACGDSGVVGGECRTGYTLCDGRCVAGSCDLLIDASAGSAGVAAGGSAGSAGASAGAGGITAGAGGGGAGSSGEAGASGNAGVSGMDAGDGSVPDGGPSDAGPDAPICSVPIDTALHCGGCDIVCAAPTPFCAPDNSGSYHCVMDCGMLTLCSTECIDLNVDPDHCGSCARACPSGICQGGMCVGANVGHVVVACDDYAQTTQTAPQTVLLANTVFLPFRNPVRVLAYTQNTPNVVRNHVATLLNGAAATRGRMAPVISNITNFSNLSTQLDIADFDVFLIEDQTNAPAGQLATIGASWQTSGVIDSFARAGGVVMVLAGATGRGEMDDFLNATQLLPVSAQTVANTTLYNRAPADGIGINVISPFVGQRNTCTFTTSASQSADTIFVIEDAAAPTQGNPSVVHRVIVP